MSLYLDRDEIVELLEEVLDAVSAMPFTLDEILSDRGRELLSQYYGEGQDESDEDDDGYGEEDYA